MVVMPRFACACFASPQTMARGKSPGSDARPTHLGCRARWFSVSRAEPTPSRRNSASHPPMGAGCSWRDRAKCARRLPPPKAGPPKGTASGHRKRQSVTPLPTGRVLAINGRLRLRRLAPRSSQRWRQSACRCIPCFHCHGPSEIRRRGAIPSDRPASTRTATSQGRLRDGLALHPRTRSRPLLPSGSPPRETGQTWRPRFCPPGRGHDRTTGLPP